jgi:6-phosphogluconolactonase (cycloisomerase 2 family)
MKGSLILRSITAIAAAVLVALCTTDASAAGKVVHYVVTDDNVAGANTATFYVAGPGPKLTQKKVVQTGGQGTGFGYYGSSRVSVVHDHTAGCVYVTDTASNDIAGIVLSTKKVIGNFKGSSTDDGGMSAIGLAMNSKFLYASFPGSNTIATFKVRSGCKLKFLKDVSAAGLQGGTIDGMALNGKILVVAYVDGSIQSFKISHGAPVSNGDEQNSTGSLIGELPAGVDISQDGHFAIFGDAGSGVDVEVSDISSGKLTTTVNYTSLATGSNSNNVRLSPDGSLLYISINFSGEVAAAFFDKTTGVLKAGCTSSPLKGFNSTWFVAVGLATQSTTGSGSPLFVAESAEGNPPSSIGIVKVKSSGGKCHLTESVDSPASDPNSGALRSIGAFPPRPF